MEFQAQMIQLTRGYAWMTGGSFFAKALAFLNINLVLWQLTAYQYGAVELAQSFISIPSLLLFAGLSSTIVADVVAHRSRNEHAMARSMFLRFLILSILGGVVAFIGVIAFSIYLGSLEGKHEVALFLQIAAIGLLLAPLRMAIQNIFTAFGLFPVLTRFTALEEIAKTAGIIAFLYIFHWGSVGLIAAITVAQGAPVLFYALRAKSLFATLGSRSEHSVNPLLLFQGHQLWSLANSTLGLVTKPIRIWLIKLLLGTEAVGLFAFAFGFFGHISGLVTLSPVFAPLAARQAHLKAEFSKLIHTTTKYQLLFSTLVAAASIPTLAIMVPIIYPNYVAALPLIYWLLVAIIPTGILALCTPIFIALKEQRSQFISGVFKVLLTVGFAFVLYPVFGVAGIGIELFLTLIVSVWERDRRLLQLRGTHLFNIHTIARFTPEDSFLVNAIARKIRTTLVRNTEKTIS